MIRLPISAIKNPTTIGKKAISIFEDECLNLRISISAIEPII